MTFEDASRFCLEHDAQIKTERSSMGHATLTLSAYGLSLSEPLGDDSWKTWSETLVALVTRLQRRMPRA